MRSVNALPEIDEDDIRRAVRHPDAEMRMAATVKICRALRSRALQPAELKLAHAILKKISGDVADIVRRALAVTLRHSPNLPKPIARQLIEDIDTIAAPILEFSPVLSEDDLRAVLRSRAAAKITAIAKRAHIEGAMVTSIIHFGDTQAIAALAANDAAILSDEDYAMMAEAYHDDDLIRASMISRRDLPVHIVEKLVTRVSEDVALNIVKRHPVSLDTALDLASRTRERATISLVDQSWTLQDMGEVCAHLHREQRLTPSLILRAAGEGKIRFVEHALAVRAELSYGRAAIMVHDTGPLGLSALCNQAGLRAATADFIRGAVSIFTGLEQSGITYDRSQFQQIMLERVLTLPHALSDADADYLLEKLDGLAADEAD